MNCTQYRDNMVPYVEGLLDESASTALEAHLAECADCRAELDEIRSLQTLLVETGQPQPSASLEAKVMSAIVRRQSQEIRKMKIHIAYRMAGVGAVAAAAIILVFAGMTFFHTDNRAEAAEMLAKAADAVSNVKSIHIKCRMRTLPADNFAMIGAGYDFVTVELWKQTEPELKWRAKKPGRTAVMDGTSTVLYITGSGGPGIAAKVGPSESAFDAGWLTELGDVGKNLDGELKSALSKGWELELAYEKGSDGAQKAALTIHAQPRVKVDPHLLNTFLTYSPTRRVYTFDKVSGRMEGMKEYIHQGDRDVLILEVADIEYNATMAPEVFELTLPDDVSWYEKPQPLPDNEKYVKMTPKEMAQAFFEACSREDWAEAEKFWPFAMPDTTKKYLGKLEVISLGEPFQAKPYGGWFIPYEIKVASGGVKKHNLAVRNDNPAKRYVFDGGL